MKVVMIIVGIVCLMSLRLKQSLAQPPAPPCWQNIMTCLSGIETWTEYRRECCPSFLQDIKTEKECFCSIKPHVVQNVSLENVVSTLLAHCSVTTSFYTICADDFGSAPSPSGSSFQSPSGFDSNTSPQSSPQSIGLSPIQTPLPSPSAEPEDLVECWRKIENCTNSNSSSTEGLECCPVFLQEITNEKECYCFIKDILRDNPPIITKFPFLFEFCSIPSSFETLCPGALLSQAETPSPPLGPSLSPSESQALFPATPGAKENVEENGVEGAVASSVVGLLLQQALLLTICAMIMC